MVEQSEYLHDVFISHAPADREWVDEWLLPRLEQVGLRVAIDYRDFIVGLPRIENIERAIESSRRTIVVLTPDWLESEWNAFEALLLRTKDPAARQRKLLPVLLRPCDLPETIAALEKVDLTAERYWEKQIKRLTRDIEDIIPVAPPWKTERGISDFAHWGKWLRRYRRPLRLGAVGIVVVWLALFMAFQLPPFQPRLVWMAEPLHAPNALVLHNTGTTLVVGGANTKEGCNVSPKGLWYRPLTPNGTWQESNVGDLLCIEDRDPPALSDIVALASLPTGRDTVYALTSHSGLLVSADGGVSFERHPAGFLALGADNCPGLLVVSDGPSPSFWVIGRKEGLLIYRDNQWSRLDGQGDRGCANLPELTVKSLLVKDDVVLIGSDREGIWVSEDSGETCRQVFDSAGRYEFYGLWDVSPATHARYLVLAYDWQVEPSGDLGTWRLLDLCPRPASCSPTEWQQEPNPVWHKSTVVNDVLIQRSSEGDYEWYLVSEFGQIWHGDMSGGKPQPLPGINRCFIWVCDAGFAPAGAGEPPYLVAADLAGRAGRVYQFTEGDWWRRLWP
jgi:hypothetical protein